MTLRIAWIGPWNKKSAIATFGAFVVDELTKRGHIVTVFRSEAGESRDLPALRAPGSVVPLPPDPRGFLADAFDGVICNIGDNYQFHGALPQFVESVPCLAIFHDGLIYNLAATWCASHLTPDDSGLRRLAVSLYGDIVPPEGEPLLTTMTEVAAKWPMTEWLARYSAGIVTHSDTWTARMRAACPGQVTVLPLAYPDLDLPPPRRIGSELVVATIGHANRNKCTEAIIRAIGSDPQLRAHCEYRLLGPIEPEEREHLTRLARAVGNVRLECTGWIDDAALRTAMSGVDVVACLRNPVLEGGSASLVTALLSARPTLVSHHGVYAEVPDGVVLSCTPGQEAEEVARHLRAILADPTAAQAMGSKARSYALKTFSAERYVDGLLPALADATAVSPALHAASRLGRILGSFGLPPDHPSVARVAGTLREAMGWREEQQSGDEAKSD